MTEISKGGRPELTPLALYAAYKTYLKVLTEETTRVGRQALSYMADLDAERLRPKGPDGAPIAAVVYSAGRVSAAVADERAAVAWCVANHPEEVVVVEAIRPAYLKKLLDAAKAEGVGIDPATGERLDWITVKQGDPFLTVTPEGDAEDRMRRVVTESTTRKELPWTTT